jgi:hypothetical protein
MSDASLPEGFIDLGPLGPGMSNNGPLDGPVIDDGLESILREVPVLARHSGWQFHGYVWWSGEEYRELVYQKGKRVASITAPTLCDLLEKVNDRFGWL